MKVTIDGQAIEVEPGTTILQAARMIGGESVPPAMCYYSKLEGSGGKCRCCLVEVAKEVTQISDQCQNLWLQNAWTEWKSTANLRIELRKSRISNRIFDESPLD
jgi:predicted molibdopterin-dependent oxidoreductase YjgC